MNKHKRIIASVVVVALILTACGGKGETTMVTPTSANIVSTPEPPKGLLEGTVAEGEGIQATVMRLCDCSLESYTHVSVLWEHKGQQMLIEGPWTLRYLGILPDEFITTWVGDKVQVGPQETISNMAQPNALTISGGYEPELDWYIFTVENGPFKEPLKIVKSGGKWSSVIKHNEYTLEEGIRLATE